MTKKDQRERVVSRRTLAVGAAWTIPAVAVAAAAPAYAASCSGTATTVTYNNTGGLNSYTGAVRTLIIPSNACRIIDFELWGGNSGTTVYGNTGRGTKLTGQLTLPAGAVTLSLIVGGGGAARGIGVTALTPGGWGYGKGGDIPAQSTANLVGSWAGAGGGGSAIKVGANLVVAAGGGGGGASAIMTRDSTGTCTSYNGGGVISWGGSGYGTGSPVGYQTLYLATSPGNTQVIWSNFNGGSNGSGGNGGIGGAVTSINSLGAPYYPSAGAQWGAWAGSAGGAIGGGTEGGGNGADGRFGTMSGTNGSAAITQSVGVGGAGGGGYGGGGSGGAGMVYDPNKCKAGAWGGSGGGAGGNYVGGGGGVGLRGLAYGINPGGDSANGYVKLTYYV